MNTYLLLKFVHIVSSVALVGVGFGSAYYMYFTNRTRNVAAIAAVARLVVRADWWFTTPAAVIQPVTGIILAKLAHYPLTATWLLASYGLYAFAGTCWLVVVWLQIKMEKMARLAAAQQAELPARYWRDARLWERLGMMAFPAMLAVYGMMVFKPGA